MDKKPQVSASIDRQTYEEILKLMVKENRSLSEMVAILLQQAVKNRLRKRKGAKENNP